MKISKFTGHEILKSGLNMLNISLNDEQLNSLTQYIELLEIYNPSLKLVGATGTTLITKHILDTLTPLNIIEKTLSCLGNKTQSVADLGSGAGLPGIPLAISLPNTLFTLIERMKRRSDFLCFTKKELNLENITVLNLQIEEVKNKFDALVFRAFRPFEVKIFKKVFKLCKKGASVFAYKGILEKTEIGITSIKDLIEEYEIIKLEVPYVEESRCLVRMLPKINS